jgi:uncharacterized membrane protein
MDLEKQSTFEDIAEKLILWVGVVSLFIGFSGLILLLSYPKIYKDEVLLFGISFVYSYMTIIGIFLVLYHGKIIVRGYRA